MSPDRNATTPEKPTDQELVRRVQQEGDPSAFDELVLRYQKQLYSVIYNMVLNHQDTEEVLMDTLVRAYRNIGTFRIEAAFYTWIYRIAHNQAINLLRKRKRAPNLVDIAAGEGDRDEGERPEYQDKNFASDATKAIAAKELGKKLNEALGELSEEHRTVVNLFDVQGLSHGEIAEITKCSEGTVRSRLHYAHKQLQKLLRHYL